MYTKEQKERAANRGKDMANERMPHHRWRMFACRIKNNPYASGSKLHVIWHNAFYDECRRIGRSI